MIWRISRLLLVTFFVSALCLGSGCSFFKRFGSKKGRGYGDGKGLEPVEFGAGGVGGAAGTGEIPLAPRVEGDEGVPVDNAAFENVQFAYDSFQVADTEVARIEEVARYLRANSGVRCVLEGHCDERGSKEYNLSLGENRALAVRAFLVGLGIDSGRIGTKSLGEEMPLDPGHGESAWWKNRRVEFKLYR